MYVYDRTTMDTPTYRRIHVTGDWGVGVANQPNIVLSTDGLIGCNALFFTSNNGRWLCHVMDGWVEKCQNSTGQDELSGNLEAAAIDFFGETNTEIADIYICRHTATGIALTNIIHAWCNIYLPNALVHHLEGYNAWYIDNTMLPQGGRLNLWGKDCLDYGEETLLRERHLFVNIPGVWHRAFIPSPLWGPGGPIFNDKDWSEEWSQNGMLI